LNKNELQTYVNRKDITGFLRVYMRRLVEGEALSMPTGQDYIKAREGWIRILPTVVVGFTTDFVEKLSRTWVGLIQAHKLYATPDYAKQILTVLYQASSVPKAEVPPSSVTGPSVIDKFADQSLISTGYYSPTDLSAVIEEKALRLQVLEALKKEDEDGFLISYLTYLYLGQVPFVPLSTVHDVISNKWEEIIIREFGVVPTSRMLLKLSSRWFYVVNLKGVPLTAEHMSLILDFFVKHRTPVSFSEHKKEKWTFKNWFNF